MTGGLAEGKRINKNLSLAAQKHNIPMGVGSQRIAIEHPEFKRLFEVRKYAPGIPLMANVGIVQLNYGFDVSHYQRAVDMIEANALVIHINPMQEIIQPEGDRNWEKILPKIEKLVKKISVPIIAKEVGFGLSYNVVKRLYGVGIKMFDTAGWGGTNWAMVEGLRGKADRQLADLYSNWGIPSAESIRECSRFRMELKSKNEKELMVILGSGGVRSGLDVAKAIALGSNLVGLAAPFGKAALISQTEVEKLIERLSLELRVAMFGVGAKSLKDLKKAVLT
jgi:isopentenyl-diphosphate delta-isomerase